MTGYAPVREMEDEELGPMRLCHACREWWPRDDEFFFFRQTGPTAGKVIGHCKACQHDYKQRRKEQPP